MIYASIQDYEQMLMIPRASRPETPAAPLRLLLRRGGKENVFGGLEDADINTLYYCVNIPSTASMATGEYDYTLEDAEGNVLGTGILTAGMYVRKTKAPQGGNKIIEYGG